MNKIARLPISQFVQDGKLIYYKDDYKLGKRKKTEVGYNLNSVDRISELPDEILVCILSLLKLKQAAATSILSRRWRFLWASTMNLKFDGYKYLEYFGPSRKLKQKLLSEECCRYVDWVNRVVEQYRGSNIKQFRARFLVDYKFTSSINSWIQFAMKHRVQTLELLSICPIGFEPYALESLDFCGYMCSKSLKVLHFRYIDVTGEVLEYFLSNCPVLERLTVYSSNNLVTLRVADPSTALKRLEIRSCLYLPSIEICDTNVVSIDIEGQVELLLCNVPLLVDVSYKTMDYAIRPITTLTNLSCCASRLKILRLDIDDGEYDENFVFPIFTNLKHLELEVVGVYVDIGFFLSSFMKAAPYLQRLVLKMKYGAYGQTYTKMEAPKCPHHHLKVLKWWGIIFILINISSTSPRMRLH